MLMQLQDAIEARYASLYEQHGRVFALDHGRVDLVQELHDALELEGPGGRPLDLAALSLQAPCVVVAIASEVALRSRFGVGDGGFWAAFAELIPTPSGQRPRLTAAFQRRSENHA